MSTLVLNGITDDPKYRAIEKTIESKLLNTGDGNIEYFRLRDMNIRYCTGCWSCWYKTPGLCAIKDEHEQILSRLPHHDNVLYVSPVIMGYESSLLKTCKDRNIPVAHPYIVLHKGEMHHRKRYDSTNDIQVLLVTDEDTNQDDLDLIRNTYDRMALNFHSQVSYFEAVNSEGGAIDAINRL